MKSDAPNNVQKVSRVLLDAAAGEHTLTNDIATTADVKPSHVSAIINNLRLREFIESQKGSAGGNEQEHRVVEANRDKFVAWLDRDTVKPPTRDPSTKGRATNKSASAHRVDLAMNRRPMSLAQLASAAESGTLPPHEDDEAADAKSAGNRTSDFYNALTKLLGLPATWERVCISMRPNDLPLVVADFVPPSILAGIVKA